MSKEMRHEDTPAGDLDPLEDYLNTLSKEEVAAFWQAEEQLQKIEEQEAASDGDRMWRSNTQPVLYDYDLGW